MDGPNRLWNIEGNKEVFSSLLDSTDVMQSVDFSCDGRFIATVAMEAQDINIWDASAGLKFKGSLKVNAEVSTVLFFGFLEASL